MSWFGKFVLAIFGLGYVMWVYQQPLVLLATVALIGLLLLIVGAMLIDQGRRLVRLTAERPGESICTFARSFDCHAIDTWIIRATFEELQPYCRFRGGVLPLRADDELDRTLGVIDLDLDDLAWAIASRAGRSMAHTERNPLSKKVKTVSDMIHFFMHQPPTLAA